MPVNIPYVHQVLSASVPIAARDTWVQIGGLTVNVPEDGDYLVLQSTRVYIGDNEAYQTIRASTAVFVDAVAVPNTELISLAINAPNHTNHMIYHEQVAGQHVLTGLTAGQEVATAVVVTAATDDASVMADGSGTSTITLVKLGD